jgi:hypothetical protein
MKILVCKPNELAEVKESSLTAKDVQDIVGGWFGIVAIESNAMMYFNDSPEGLKFNKQIGEQSVHGTFIVAGWNEDETDLTEQQITYWTTRLAQSQTQPDA